MVAVGDLRAAHLVPLMAVALVGSACYGGKRATRDVNRAWQGHTRDQLVAAWGKPARVQTHGDQRALVWTITGHHITLPQISGRIDVRPGSIEAEGSFEPGTIRRTFRHVIARVDASGTIVNVRGPSLRWGPPEGLNMRWGFLFGVHAGFGRLDDTGSPLPSGGLYIGGMLSKTIGLVGVYSMAAGKQDGEGSAMGFAWGLGVQWWPSARLWLRAAPAMVLGFDPGFENAGLEPGITTGASYALVRRKSFVFDFRVDLTSGTSTAFGTVGLGVNIN